jgi:proteasome lid subunit RPN8/RPN11
MLNSVTELTRKIAPFLASESIDTSKELCGYILSGEVIFCENVSDTPEKSFEFSREDTLKLAFLIEKEKDVVVWHTHVNHNGFLSTPDIKTCRAWGIPFFMFNTKTGISDYYDPKEYVSYIGRPWSYSYRNCYDLFKDFYKTEFQIELPEFYLNHPTAWEDEGWNMYLENLPRNGFIQQKLSEYKFGDVFLMKIGKASGPNHIGIALEPEKNQFLHHLTSRASEISSLNQAYRKRIHSTWRHRSQCS